MASLSRWVALLLLVALPQVGETCLFPYPAYDFELFPMGYAAVGQFYPYLYSPSLFKYWYNSNRHSDTTVIGDLSDEWVAYTRGQVPLEEIHAFQYWTAADALLELDTTAPFPRDILTTQPKPDSQNGLVAWAQQPGRSEVLDYLTLCKSVEWVSEPYEDPWGFAREDVAKELQSRHAEDEHSWSAVYDTLESRAVATLRYQYRQLLPRCETALATVKDPWLRRRYAYQRLLMGRYLGQAAYCKQLYQTHLAGPDVPKGLQLWAQLHLGIALTKAGRAAEGNLHLARVFAQSVEKQRPAFIHYRSQARDSALQLATTAEDKAAIWQLAAAHVPSFYAEGIQRVHALTGPSETLRFLVLREIGKVDTYMPWERLKIENYGDSISRRKPVAASVYQLPLTPGVRRHVTFLAGICEQAARNPQTPRRTLWNLMAAHLHLYLSDYTKAEAALDRARQAGLAPDQRNIVPMYQAILTTYRTDLSGRRRHDRLATLLREGLPAADTTEWGPNEPARSVGYLLVKRLEHLDDTIGADLVSCAVGYQAAYRAPQSLYEGFQKNTLGPLGELARTRCRDLTPHLYRVQAVLALLDEKPAQAARFYELAGDTVPSRWLNEDARCVNYWRNHGSNQLPDTTALSPAQWCRNLAELQRTAGNDFQKNLALANCYYNMTYDGNSWYILSRSWTTSRYNDDDEAMRENWLWFPDQRRKKPVQPFQARWDMMTFNELQTAHVFLPVKQMNRYLNAYYGATLARKYFQRAMTFAPSRKAAAACALMVGRCRYRAWYDSFPPLLGNGAYYGYGEQTADEPYAGRRIRATYTELYTRYPDLADALVSNCLTYERFIQLR